MTRDYVISFAAEGLAVLLSLLVYRAAAAQWPQETFAEYALSRKILSVLLVVALVGMDTAVVRAVAFEGRARARGQLLAALLIAAVASAALLVVLVAVPEPLGRILYGEAGHAGLLPALGLAGIGGALYGIAYGYERAHLRIGHAAVLLVLVTGLVPLVAVTAFAGSAAAALAAMGAGWILVGGGMLATRLRAARPAPLRPLIRYGAPRAAGLLLQMGFLAAPGVIVANRFGLVEAGNVAFALLVLGLLSTLLTPIGVVLMPRSAHMLREKAAVPLRRHVGRLVAMVVPVVTALVIAAQIGAEPLVTAYLGASYAAAVPAVRAILWAAIPWSVFVALRGFLDAYDVRPLNARNVLVASLVYAVLVASTIVAGADEAAYHVSFVAAAVVLGVLTLLDARRALERPGLPQPVVEDALQP